VNALILVNGENVNDAAILSATRINYDSTRRLATASITLIGRAPGELATYDNAYYDVDYYAVDVGELYPVTILDARDGVTKLFEGLVYGLSMKQTDTTPEVLYECELNDHASWLDRSVAWDDSYTITMPATDKALIEALVGKFCARIHATHVTQALSTSIQAFEWKAKTIRQVLDDIAGLSMAEWHVDFDANLWYGPAGSVPAAAYGLSTSPDYTTTFPVRVDGWKRDFSNPVNHAYVRGAVDPATGILAQAEYSDPPSISTYGEFDYSIVDEQITQASDASLRAQTTVLKYKQPIEQGSFTIWTDGLHVGEQVYIVEDSLGINGNYIIRSLALVWQDPALVEYRAEFGAAQPDLETYLRLLDQRTRWKSAFPLGKSTPAPGSVTDASIASPGLSAGSIQSVNATTIQGKVTAGQIQSVNANTILGQVTASQISTVNAGSIQGQVSASQIGTVNASSIQGSISSGQIGSVAATTITGSITSGQIGSVSATTITGVVVSSQLADQIISDIAKYADALKPVRIVKTSDPWPPTLPNKNFPANSFFYYEPDGHFYQMNAAGTSWNLNDNPQGSLTNFYSIGRISATSITGLIVAAQIQSITAGQITGSITSGQIASITAGQITGSITSSQIGSVAASTITGTLTASQIASVNATAIAGTITSGQIASVAASTITGTIAAGQIASVNASAISGTITAGQIGSVNGAVINVGTVGDSQIGNVSGGKITAGTVSSAQLNSYSIDVGGPSQPGRIRVYNGGTMVGEMGYLDATGNYGGWFQLFGAGGSSYSDAKVKTDTGGNLSIINASFSVSGGGSTLATSPSTFDDVGYGSLALNNTGGNDKAQFISRGMVIYYGGTKVAAFNRAPSTANGELTIQNTAGGNYIFLDGSTGRVRADGGFQVGGNLGQTRTVTISGTTLYFTGGLLTG